MSGTSTVRSVLSVASDRDLTLLAASIAYYAFVSLIPLVLLALVAASVVGGQALAEQVTALTEQFLSSAGQDVLGQALTGESGRTGAGVVGVVVLAWSALKLFRGLDIAFAKLYGTPKNPSLPKQILDGLVVLVAAAIAVALVVVVGAVLGVAAGTIDVPFVRLLSRVVLILVLLVVFLPVYYVLPPVDTSVGGVVPGALFAAVGWVLLQVGFQVYAANASRYQAYGLLGAVLLFLTFLYFGAVVVLLGAVINAVRAGRG